MIALKSCWNYSLQFLGLRGILACWESALHCPVFFHHLVLLETLQLRYLQAAFCSTSVSGASAASAAFLCQSKASFNYLLCIPLLLSLCIHWWARCMLWNSVARTAWWWALPGAIRVTCCHTGLLLAHQPIAWDQHSAVSDGIFQDSADK